MPRSWSYRKYQSTSVTQRVQNPPANLTIYTIILIIVACFFLGFMTYTTIRTAVHPPRDGRVFPSTEPKDD
jgi:hypothetical protein